MNRSRLEVLFSPAEFMALKERDLAATTCVVFDILRATTSIVTALANGASAVIPVETIEEAVAYKQREPTFLLAGERHGLRIEGFDFGNSPREFTRTRVEGRTLLMTTTNGTRGLKSCAHASEILAASFLNLGAVSSHLTLRGFSNLLLVCSGTYEEGSYEDTLAAGALADALWGEFNEDDISDSAQVARNVYLAAKSNIQQAMTFAKNGRRLLRMPDLAGDVPFCVQRDTLSLVARLSAGRVIKG